VTENIFRRQSLTDHGVEKIESFRIEGILGQIGQTFDKAELEKFIKSLDTSSKCAPINGLFSILVQL